MDTQNRDAGVSALFHLVRSVVRGGAILFLGLFAILGRSLPAQTQFLPGFTLNGESWTYTEAGQPTVSGLLIRPSGPGPFPAVIISHGKGSTVGSFTRSKAQTMAAWGLVCIGPRYTHATDDPDFNNTSLEGSRAENLRRALVCYRILQSLPEVRGHRVGLYGNSMGAFVSIGLAGLHPAKFTAAAITAGGIVPSGDAAAPNVSEASTIRTPFLMLHGEIDGTVPPERSLLLKQALDANGVTNQRITWPNVGHDLHQVRATEVNAAIQTWFTERGLFADEPARTPTAPQGIYVLDSNQGTAHNGSTLRDANIRTYGFLRGYTLRAEWAMLEPSEGQYDFTIIDNILGKLPAGQKLSLIIIPFEPHYIASTAGVTTWQDKDRSGNALTRAVPWDSYLRTRRRALYEALAEHATGGVQLRANPALDGIDPYLAGGFTGVRDPNTVPLRQLPGYTRALLLDAVRDELRAATSQFPNTFVHIGFWKVADTQSSPAAWEEIRLALLEDFDGVARPRVGFFMENLAASRPAGGGEPVTGYPVTDFGAPLHLSRDATWTGFQALTSWKAPFTGPDKVANASPADGIRYAFETYGARYFELYVSDVDHAAWQPDLEEWADTLAETQQTSSATVWIVR